MASIVDLIAKHGDGGQTFPARMAQMAQAKNTEQRTEIERQQADEQSAMREFQLDSLKSERDNRNILNDIAKDSTSTKEWIGRLKEKGFMEEAQQAEKFSLGLEQQRQELDEGRRESNAEEASELSRMLRGVENQDGLNAFFKQWNDRHPDSDLEDSLPKIWNDKNRSAFNMAIFAGQDTADSWRQEKENRIQQRHKDNLGARGRSGDQADTRNEQSDRRLDISEEKLSMKKDDQELRRKKAGAEFQSQIDNDDELLLRLENVKGLIEKNPASVGGIGLAKEGIAGLLGQMGPPGRWLEQFVQSDEDLEISAGIALLTGILIPRVLNDDSGRYSDEDMKRVKEINSGRSWERSPKQTTAMIDELIEITKRGRARSRGRIDAYDFSSKAKKVEKSKFSHLWNKAE